MEITIRSAQREEAPTIAKLIMEAMNHECCLWFAGEGHTLEEFFVVMKRLVEAEGTQYSYHNVLVAVGASSEIAGMCVSYDGGRLHVLRKAFFDVMLSAFGQDHSNMPDETETGELYVDSLCVVREYRGQGIAAKLLQATKEKGRKMGLPVGLLVDECNPDAERLYLREGFQFVGVNEWGGHRMKHMLFRI